jgi:hypothetical protein
MRTFWNERAKIKLERAKISADLMLQFDAMLDKYQDITDGMRKWGRTKTSIYTCCGNYQIPLFFRA